MVDKKGKTISGHTYHTSAQSAKERDELKKKFKGQNYSVRTKKSGKGYDIFTKVRKKQKKPKKSGFDKEAERTFKYSEKQRKKMQKYYSKKGRYYREPESGTWRMFNNLFKSPRWVLRQRKNTAKNSMRPSTIIGFPSNKGIGKHRVEYKNTWWNRVRRLNEHIG